jgi:hypothetical protein
MVSPEEVSRISDLWIHKSVPYPLGHGVTIATIFEMTQIKLNTELYIISCKLYWKPHTTEKDTQMTDLIQTTTYTN